mgnify:CR=1 FL=1
MVMEQEIVAQQEVTVAFRVPRPAYARIFALAAARGDRRGGRVVVSPVLRELVLAGLAAAEDARPAEEVRDG